MAVEERACLIFTGCSLVVGLAFGVLCGLLIRTNQLKFLVDRARVALETQNDELYYVSSDDEEEEETDVRQQPKLMLCVRNDLKMGKGKMCAQAAHAALGAYRACCRTKWRYLDAWIKTGQAKVAVKIKSEEELTALYMTAAKTRLPAYIVRDAGRTQIAPGSTTVLAIGPAPSSFLDDITGSLPLL